MPALAALLARPLHRTGRPLLARFRSLFTLRRERSRLARLDDHLLADIGLTRAEAVAEADRPVWDVPPHWRG